ncbi:MAG: hypothetical protein AAGA68_26185 [Pseudomonadota bacterium]
MSTKPTLSVLRPQAPFAQPLVPQSQRDESKHGLPRFEQIGGHLALVCSDRIK